MIVAVVGATGVLGRNVIPRLLERGHRVHVLVRTDRLVPWLRLLGATTHRGDILKRETLRPAFAGADAVLHLATAIPAPQKMSRPDAWFVNDQIRIEGTDNCLSAAEAQGVQRYVQQSIATLHAGYGDAWVDEETPFRTDWITKSSADMEAKVWQSALDWIVLRGGAFYGPGADRDALWRQQARRGTLGLPENNDDFISLIHVSDMASAVVLALECARPGDILNVVDDEPVTYRALFMHIAALEGAEPPSPGGPAARPSCRVRNHRIRERLGWVPHYASFRAGIV